MLAGMLRLSYLWVPFIFHFPRGLVGCCQIKTDGLWVDGVVCLHGLLKWHDCVPCFYFLHCESVVRGFVLNGLLPPPPPPRTHTHVCAHTHIYIYIYTYAHAHQPHLSFQTTRALTLILTMMPTHALTWAHTHTDTHTYILCNMTNTYSLLAAKKMGVCLYWVVCLPVVCSAWGWSYLLPVLSVSVNSPSPVGLTSPHHLFFLFALYFGVSLYCTLLGSSNCLKYMHKHTHTHAYIHKHACARQCLYGEPNISERWFGPRTKIQGQQLAGHTEKVFRLVAVFSSFMFCLFIQIAQEGPLDVDIVPSAENPELSEVPSSRVGQN